MSNNRKTVFLAAGEASGDLHGANLVRAMNRLASDFRVVGIGGPHLRETGMETLIDASSLSVVGITEVIAHLPVVLQSLSSTKRFLREVRPDLVVLIDYPDFNLRIAKEAKRLGLPVFYYISPQIWAWRESRVHIIRERVNHMAVILPFEAPFYERHGVPVTFVGHPLMDTELGRLPSDPAPQPAGEDPIIGLLPGSRIGEVRRLLPIMLDAARLLSLQKPSVRFLLSQAPGIPDDLLQSTLQEKGTVPIEISRNLLDIFRRSALVIAASGTVTLQAAIAGVPMLIVYKVSPLSYFLGKMLIRVPFIGLINLIAAKRIVPELIQQHADARTIAHTVFELTSDPERLCSIRNDLVEARRLLGGPGASERAARIALSLMERSK